MIQFQETNDDFFSSKESTSFLATTATTFNGCIWFGFRKQTTIFFIKRVNVFFGHYSYDIQWMYFILFQETNEDFFQRVNVFFGDNSYDIQWMYLIRFQETNDDFFFLQKSRLLFRQQKLLHSMDALDSVSGNKRRFFFSSKESTSFSPTTATTLNGCILFLRLF